MYLSIIIPCYNSSSTIADSIDSVVRECVVNDYDWEVIVVNDGSKDDSVEVVRRYIDGSPCKDNLKLICQSNGGAAAARNTGIRAAKGEFIAFNDSDDRWLSGKLRLQMEYMKANEDVDALGCVYGSDDFRKGSLIKLDHVTKIPISSQVSKNYFSPPTVIFRKSVIVKSGLFNEKLRYAEEGYFFNNMVYHNNCVFMQKTVAEAITSKSRWGDSGLSGNLVKMEQGELFNISSAYKMGYISLGRYIFAVCFSLAKFTRRWMISKYRKLCR